MLPEGVGVPPMELLKYNFSNSLGTRCFAEKIDRWGRRSKISIWRLRSEIEQTTLFSLRRRLIDVWSVSDFSLKLDSNKQDFLQSLAWFKGKITGKLIICDGKKHVKTMVSCRYCRFSLQSMTNPLTQNLPRFAWQVPRCHTPSAARSRPGLIPVQWEMPDAQWERIHVCTYDVCVCVNIYMHKYVGVYVYVNVLYICTCTCTCVYVCMCVCLYVRMSVCLYVCISVCLYVCIYLSIYLSIYLIYLSIYVSR